MSKYIIPVSGSNVTADCSVAANGGILVNCLVQVPASGGTPVAASGTAFSVALPGITANGFVGEVLTGGTTENMTPCTLEYDDDNGVVLVKSPLGIAAGKANAFSGFIAMK